MLTGPQGKSELSVRRSERVIIVIVACQVAHPGTEGLVCSLSSVSWNLGRLERGVESWCTTKTVTCVYQLAVLTWSSEGFCVVWQILEKDVDCLEDNKSFKNVANETAISRSLGLPTLELGHSLE